jgi:hypothetical protein
VPAAGQHHADCAVEFGWDREAGIQNRYQVAAVTRAGKKLLDSHFLGYTAEGKSPVEFHCPLDEIDHFELRPFGGGHRFFFAGLRLPRLTTGGPQAFAEPPTAVAKVGGQTVQAVAIPAFAPLDIRLQIADGFPFSGSVAGSNYHRLVPNPEGPQQLGAGFTLVLQSEGLGEPPYAVAVRTAGSKQWTPANTLPRRGGFRAGAPNRGLMSTAFLLPLQEIDELEITLLPAQ